MFTLLLPALARPPGPAAAVCDVYPDEPLCSGSVAPCTLCHVLPPTLNPYGTAVLGELDPELSYSEGVIAALPYIEAADSDGDGQSNLAELIAGTSPGDELSVNPSPEDAPEGSGALYDPEFAFRRLMTAFCGHSPTYDEVEELRSASDPATLLHAQLDRCLESPTWRHEIVPRFADERIRPIASLGTCVSMMANFEFDYHLFTWAMTEGRDARELLTADYYVTSSDQGSSYPELRVHDDSAGLPYPPAQRAGISCTDVRGFPATNNAGGQTLEPAHRAGMFTTQWFLTLNTQASYLPRTTAAAAYRSWLGFEIAAYEGMYPIDGEPLDIDRKSIDVQPCAQCHSTLDPLSYAFAHYNGVSLIFGGNGSYNENRPIELFSADPAIREDWAAEAPVAALSGELIPTEPGGDAPSVVELARRAAESDAFARNLTSILFEHATGGPPEGKDQAEFRALWMGLQDGGYSIDAMAHDLIDTHAFGAP